VKELKGMSGRPAKGLIESLTVDAPGFVSVIFVVELGWVLSSAHGLTREQLGQAFEMLLRTKENHHRPRRPGPASAPGFQRHFSRLRGSPGRALDRRRGRRWTRWSGSMWRWRGRN